MKKKIGGVKLDSKSKWRLKNPIKASYGILRDNAKRRGKEFNLTLKEFELFCIKTKLITANGIKSENYTVDRIDCSKGYTIDNIQVLDREQNGVKGAMERFYRFIQDNNGSGEIRIFRKSGEELEVEEF